MATAPAFSSTPKIGSGLVPATLDASLTAPTNVTTIVTGAAGGTQVYELVCEGVGTTVAGVVNVFIHDGTTYHLYDQFVVAAVTSSATAAAFRDRKQFTNLILPSTSHSIRVTTTIAGNQSMLKVTAHCGDF